MAQYFRPRHASSSVAVKNTDNVQISHSDRRSKRTDTNVPLSGSSILIFPSAPSERRSSCGSGIESQYELTGSTPSLPTDVSLTSFSGRGSQSAVDHPLMGSEFSWQDAASSRPASFGINIAWDELLLEEIASGASDWEADSSIFRRVARRWSPSVRPATMAPTPPRGHIRSRTSSSLSTTLSRSLPISPEPPFRLPFLSFLKCFLTLDESTLHLISRSPDSDIPALFASSPGSFTVMEGNSEDDAVHGPVKLLLYNPDKPQEATLLKASMDSSEVPEENNGLMMMPSHVSVWKLMNFVISGGTRAWREVRIWGMGEPPLIGV